MVNVGDKPQTHRKATASGTILMRAETLSLINGGHAKKGDVFGVARIAAIQAAKKTADLIPLAHPIFISKVDVQLLADEAASSVECRVSVETVGPTGVEMEALCAVSVGLLTIYDMLKAVDRGMIISSIKLLEKHGGQTGDWRLEQLNDTPNIV